ncbi:MAG: hypothetical protein EXS51_00460 [Candidatus Taylorbacteria bacterium]|nr:hypothetical protein [Candidatus Taylorbacteria bacterium]
MNSKTGRIWTIKNSSKRLRTRPASAVLFAFSGLCNTSICVVFSICMLWAKRIKILCAVACLPVFFVLLFVLLPHRVKANLTQYRLVQQFLPTYRSLRKLPDVLYFPYYFRAGTLPVWKLSIDRVGIAYLNEHLPQDPFSSISLDENRVFTKAVFSAPDYQGQVDARYAGLNSNHWNSQQKSLRLEFPNNAPFHGQRSVSLIIPSDKNYFAELLNQHRAEKFGLLTRDAHLVNVYVNGRDNVYLAFTHWTKELIQGKPWPETSILYGFNDGDKNLMGGNDSNYSSFVNLFAQDGLTFWKSYTDSVNYQEPLDTFLKILNYADDETFVRAAPRIIDMESFYKWDILSILAGNPRDNFENIGLLFNTATGRFELVPVDTLVGPLDDLFTEGTTLAKRILAIPAFKDERNRLLSEYLADPQNGADDLAFYDSVVSEAKADIFKDASKKDTNFEFSKEIKTDRAYFAGNIQQAEQILRATYTPPAVSSDKSKLVFSGSFQRFNETYGTRDAFLSREPQFVPRGLDMVALESGTHIFQKTVIVPAGMRVVIDPGALLYFGKGVSIVSYSPVNVRGTAEAPVYLRRAEPESAWGSFFVVGTKRDRSSLDFVRFDGGSGLQQNGITATGMVAFHDADVEIRNTSFTHSEEDDALNVKGSTLLIERSFFENTFHDAIDGDMLRPDSHIHDNVFQKVGIGSTAGVPHAGDCIDISWSTVRINGNKILGCTDKGVSVGESSTPDIFDNVIEQVAIGIAVKDSSRATIASTTIRHAGIGISAYRKKEVFEGGVATVRAVTLEDVKIPSEQDSVSRIDRF